MKLFICVQRKRALGDVLWIEPLLRHLAPKYYFVFVNTHYADLFKNYPIKNVYFRKTQHPIVKLFREISKIFFKGIGFLNLDNVYENSPKMHLLRAYSIAAGYPNMPLSYPVLYLPKSPPKRTSEKTVVLHMSAPSKQLNFRAVYGVDWVCIKKYLEQLGFLVVGLTDDISEKHLYSEIVSPSVTDLVSLIDSCDLFIGLDSGPSHIAASLKKPAIIFFGSVNPNYRHLLTSFVGKIMQKPCIHAGCYHNFLDGADRKCLLVDTTVPAPCCTFTTQDVLSAIESLMPRG